MTVLWLTFQTALGVTLTCVVIGVPTAYVLAGARETTRNLLLLAVVLPFLTSILIRTYAWMALLGRHGVVNQALLATGLIDAPLRLMHNTFGVYVGMTHVLLPFMILPVYSVMARIDGHLPRAAASLGASPARTFTTVVLPLARHRLRGAARVPDRHRLLHHPGAARRRGPDDLEPHQCSDGAPELAFGSALARAPPGDDGAHGPLRPDPGPGPDGGLRRCDCCSGRSPG
jgi:hypothetical protein